MVWLPLLYVLQICIGQGHIASGNQLVISDEIISNEFNDQLATRNAPQQQLQDDDLSEIVAELHRSLRFDPPKLDFGAWSIGTARSHTVTLVNKNANRSVYLSSVSGKTPAFYSSFFENKVVPPQGNTTFNVVFLPRTHGAVTTNLLIHTSFGQAKLLVKGEGKECPYRLKPIVGIRAPFNSTLAPEIHMYNPHEKALQILEVYSSGGQFQLELPSGGQEGPQALWEIPPHSTKPIIRIRFNGINTGNHTAYIRIKISELNEDNVTNENVLVIPVEFEILAKHGLYSENPILDFGRLTTSDKAKSIKIELKNSGRKAMEFVDYTLINCKSNGININIKDSTISIDPAQVDEDSLIDGQLIIRSTSQQNTSEVFEFMMFIRAEIFKGSLTFNSNTTTFITKSKSFVDSSRSFYIKNDFAIPIAILNLTLETIDSSIFLLTNLRTGVMQPGESIAFFEIHVVDYRANFESSFNILTNITSYKVPIIVCTGLLHWQTLDAEDGTPIPQNTILDLGTIPYGELSHSGYIVLRNSNPIPIELSSWDFTSPEGVYFHSIFLGCLKVEKQMRSQAATFADSKFELCFNLLQNDLAVYKIAIQSFKPKPLTGAFKIWTNHQQITTAVKFSTVMGKLEVAQELLYFKNCFPGRVCSSELSIRSTFFKPMRINAINFTDPGLRFEDYADEGSWIASNTLTKVGRIYFEPEKLCQNRCYIPVGENASRSSYAAIAAAAATSTSTTSSEKIDLSFDESELRRRTEIFRHLKWYLQSIAFTLNSTEIRQFKLNLTIDIEWPKLVSGKQMMSAVEVGHTHKTEVFVRNPSESPLLIDFFMSDPKFSKNTRLSLPLEVVDICTHCYLTDKDVFSLPKAHTPMVIPPHGYLPISVEFSSDDVGQFSTILHIRNNLTLYEAVWLTAKTVQSQFKFGNRKPGSNTPLLFEVGEKHLSPCLSTKHPGEHVQVTTKRTFTARNSGEVPILVESFLIGDIPCEAFGFKVIDCSGFKLGANASKKIDIAFSPDFTLARVSRPLILKTNLSYYVNYVLLATMPPSSLDQCSELLPRPHWEQRIKNIAIGMLVTILVFVLIASHFDSDKVLSDHLRFMSRDKGPLQPPLNLKNIVTKAAPTVLCGDTNNVTQNAQNNNNRSSRNSNKNCNISSLRRRTTKKSATSGTNSSNNMNSVCQDNSSWVQELSKNCKDTTSHPVKISADKNSRSKEEAKSLQSQKYSDPEKCSGGSVENSDKEKQSQKPRSDAPQQSVQNHNQLESNKKQRYPLRKIRSQCKENISDGGKERVDERLQKQPAPSRSPKQLSKVTDRKSDNNLKSNEAIVVVASNLETSNFTSNKQVNGNGLNVNENGKKYGKTPGRERKKEQQSSSAVSGGKRYERKQKIKGNSLNFSAPLPNSNNGPLHTAWDTNQVSFSNVVAQKNPTNIAADESTFEGNDFFNFKLRDWNEAADVNSGSIINQPQSIDKMNLVELGPIGSKKSPSSTPIWEPLPSSSNVQLSKPALSNNSSFFSNLVPPYVYNDSNQYIGSIPSEIYDMKCAEEQLQRHWQTSEYLFTLQEQQQQQQQQQQQMQNQSQQNHEESNYTEDTAWPMGTHTWTPMGYGPPAPPKSPSINPWQRPNLRPPPGLELPKRDELQEPSVLANSPPKAFATAGHQQQNGQLMPTTNINDIEIDPIQPFDPFGSLSSIWAENWNKKNNGTI